MKKNKKYILVCEKGWHGIRQLTLDLADKGICSTVLIRGVVDKSAREMITKRREIKNIFIPERIFTPFLFVYVFNSLILSQGKILAVFLTKDKSFKRLKLFKRIFSRLELAIVHDQV